MTTLATSRLLLPPPPQLLPILSAAASGHKMHPDKLLMHAHGVTSPRLCPTGQLVKPAPSSVDSSVEYLPSTTVEDDDMTGDMIDEVASVCDSEDSELSVGQEDCDRGNNLLAASADSESVGPVSRPTSADENPPRSAPLMEELADPFSMAALRIPAVPIVRPSPTRFQEEFLRKSHIYAEELMKQQMQFMAAARASAFSLRQSTEQATENIHNFSGIHSHLSAITKMTQMSQMTQNGGDSALSKLTAFGLVAQSANSSASSLNQLQQQMQAHLPFMNNNIHEPSLKFSIDNILKADFGRRITDPLIKLGGGGAGGSARGRNNKRADKNIASSAKVNGVGSATSTTTATIGAPIDLTSVCNGVAPPSTTTLPNNHCTNSNDSTSTVFSSNYSTPVKSPTSASSANTTAASPSEAAGADNSAEPCGSGSGNASTSSGSGSGGSNGPIVWPAWVYCTRYSDRPSSGRSPRTRKPKKPPGEKGNTPVSEDKRPRTAFSGSQLARLKHEFTENRYLTEKRRQQLSAELGLNEAQIKIWFQNKRAKIKKSSGTKNPLALQLMAQGLYNHSTIPLTKEEEELQELQAKAASSA